MLTFQINFKYKGQRYEAKVQKISAWKDDPIRYHLFDIKPGISGNETAIFTVDHTDETPFLSFGLPDGNLELSSIMAVAIIETCRKMGIPLFTDKTGKQASS